MPQTIALTLLIAAVFTLFSTALQTRLRARLKRFPALVWLLPVTLTARRCRCLPDVETCHAVLPSSASGLPDVGPRGGYKPFFCC